MVKSKYKAIGFDHTGVIVGDSAQKFHQKICTVIGIPVSDFVKVYVKYNLDFNAGKISKREFWATVLEDLKKGQFYYEVMEVVDSPRLLNNEIVHLIHDLKEKGYKLGILSNDTLEGAKVIREEEKMGELFDVILVSAETGLAKPTKEAFLDFLDKLGVEPEELVFIDDAKANLLVAESLGITAVYCEDVKNVKRQLEDLGVI